MNLEQRVKYLEGIILSLVKSDRFIFQKDLQFQDGSDFQFATGTGTKIGTGTTQKLSFYGVSPVAQQGAISAPSVPGATYAQSEAQSAVTAINSLRTTLKNIGITA